jgi:MFS family permease
MRRLWFTFFLICVPILIGSIDLTAIVVVLPQATLDLLGAEGLGRADQALWVVTAYLLAYTISLALVGRLSDSLPRKTVFLACSIIFIIGAAWSAWAVDFPLRLLQALPIWPEPTMLPLISLIIGRVIQAAGAGALVSVGMALVGDIFPEDRRAEPISLIGAIDSIGWVIGNLYAGVLLQVLPSWRWLFAINGVVAAVALVLTYFALRGVEAGRGGQRYDWRGAAVFACALVALTIGVEFMNAHPQTGALLLGLSLLLLIGFVLLQRASANALISMAFVGQKGNRAALLVNLIVGFALILIVAGVPLVINLRAIFLRGEGLLTGALHAGITLCAMTIPLVAGVLIGERYYHKAGAAILVTLGLLLAAIGFLLTTSWTYMLDTLPLAAPLTLVGAGLGLAMGPLSLVVVESARAAERGLASSLVLVMRLLGMTIGTPLAASLTLNLANQWASEQANRLSQTFAPVARPMIVPPMAVDALARVLLSGAILCAVGAVVFYLPAALKAGGKAWRYGLLCLPMLTGVIAIVFAGGAFYSTNAPAVLQHPVAYRLPEQVEFYLGFNFQQAFLVNSGRPLDALVDVLETAASGPTEMPPSSETPPPPTAEAAATPAPTSEPATAIPEATPAPPVATPVVIPEDPTAIEPLRAEDTATDSIVKRLFAPRFWNNDSYAPFCPPNTGPDQYQYCFNNGFLSWIGPQAAFTLLPTGSPLLVTTGRRDVADAPNYEFAFLFQATNRNNAIQFATNLATALGETPPVQVRPNLHRMLINVGRPTARALAITDAYMIIGSPRAVEIISNFRGGSLGQSARFRQAVGGLPNDDFATFYFRSEDLAETIRPALGAILESAVVDSMLKTIEQLTPLAEASQPETLIGLGLRVDEQRLSVNLAASVPALLGLVRSTPVPAAHLAKVPADAQAWVAVNLNLSDLASSWDIDVILASLSQLLEGGGDTQNVLSNPLVQAPLTALLEAFRGVLQQAQGTIIFVILPQSDGQRSLIIPMVGGQASQMAVAKLKPVLGIVGLLGGKLETATVAGQEAVLLSGDPIDSLLGASVGYMLTSDDTLLLAIGPNPLQILEQMATTRGNGRPRTSNRGIQGITLLPSRKSEVYWAISGGIEGGLLGVRAILFAPE